MKIISQAPKGHQAFDYDYVINWHKGILGVDVSVPENEIREPSSAFAQRPKSGIVKACVGGEGAAGRNRLCKKNWQELAQEVEKER